MLLYYLNSCASYGSMSRNKIISKGIACFLYLPATQDGTSWGESSKPDLFLNFILKVRMLRFSRHSQLKCRKSSFLEQKHFFWAFLRTEDWRLRIEDWGQPFHLLWLASFSPFETTKILINWKNPQSPACRIAQLVPPCTRGQGVLQALTSRLGP